MLRLGSEGRGKDYRPLRGVVESVLRLAYVRDWPASLWGRVPRSCDVRVVRRELDVLPPGARRVRLGFVSDLHIGPTTPKALLERGFDLLRDADLDVLLLGGDYVFLDATAAKARTLAELVERVPARTKLAVLGNHDLWTRHGVLESALRGAGVRILVNEKIEVAERVVLVGLDDPWTGELDARSGLMEVDPSDALVVLCHSPDGVPAVVAELERRGRNARAVYLCGHTHGGQIAAPWGPLYAPGPMGLTYPHGLHRVGPLFVHVSRGLGTTELPIRAFAPPDVVVVDLVAT